MEKQSLTDKMKAILTDCHEREVNGKEPCNEKIIEIASELFLNGLVEMRIHNYADGRKAAYFITKKGKEILQP